MPPTELDVIVARALLLGLIPVALVGPPRWAVTAWLVMANLDATGSGQATHAQVGWLNALKAVALPAWLLFRLRSVPGQVYVSFGGRVWLLLAGYAAVAVLWSDFPLAGLKLAVGMVAILAALALLERARNAGALDRTVMLTFLGATLALGILQTAFFTDGSFGFAGRGMPQRLTSFVAAQQYAALLAALVAWALWTADLSARGRTLLVLMLLAALAANGSRTWSAGALAAVAIHGLASRRLLPAVLRVAAAAALLAAVPAVRREWSAKPEPEPANRLTATASALLTGQDRADGMGLGTMRFRLAMYRGVLRELRTSHPWQWLFGHGTAAGGQVALSLFPAAYRRESLDANRVIHNEWLRVAYEWGLVGTVLWLTVVGSLASLAWRRRGEPAGGALLAYLPALLLGLTLENVIDGAGNAVTAGLLVLTALALEPPPDGLPRRGFS